MTEIVELSDDIEENYDRFIVESLELGCVWGLEGPEGWALCPSEKYDDSDVMPFWSQQAFANVHCRDEWKDYKPVAIDVMEFLEDWLQGMHDDAALVGINWDAEMEGQECEPLDLLEEMEIELS